MKIYATSITLRTVCRTCGGIFEMTSDFGDEPKPVEEIELYTHEAADAAGFCDSQCSKCLCETLTKEAV